MRIEDIDIPDDMPAVARRGPCMGDECVAEGVERMFSRRFLCDACCGKEGKANREGTKVVVEYDDTADETHIITGLSSDAVLESIGHRGCALAGDVKVLDNDPLAGLWAATDEGRLDAVRIGVSPGPCGEFVRFSFSTLYPIVPIS